MGILGGLFRRAPSFASWSAISLPIMHVRALTFWIVILCVDHVIWLTIAAMSRLSRWLSWDDGCHMWLFIRYILLRLFVRMWVSRVWYYVLCIAIRMAFSSILRMFCRPGSLSAILFWNKDVSMLWVLCLSQCFTIHNILLVIIDIWLVIMMYAFLI